LAYTSLNRRPITVFRPVVGSITLSVIVSFYLVLATNGTFWKKAGGYLSGSPAADMALYPALFLVFVAIITTFSVKYVIKPLSIALIFAAAAGSWFMDRFGVIIDRDMIRNAFETTTAEAGDLMTAGFVWHMILFAVLPSLLVIWVRVAHRSFLSKVLWNWITIISCLTIVGLIFFANAKTLMIVHRQHKDMLATVNPIAPISATIQYFRQAQTEAEVVVAPLGTDAKIRPPVAGLTKPRVTIVVAGETARAVNFSLNGYARDTNPELEKRNVFYFPSTESCGTATATSIPCMFSNLGRSGYSHEKAASQETLVDVLAHAGVKVTWWDNNTGDKGVAKRIETVNFFGGKDPRFCEEGECHDDIMIEKLGAWLDGVTKDSVIVLHQLGSHGPAYHQRYPKEFGKFTPDCQAAQPTDCADAELINAYDNTILYTDHVLSEVIDLLKARSDKLASGMIYASDHGESLGENGLYLHGAPYFMAPKEQTHVPMLVWMDHDFSASMGLDRACLTKEAAAGGRSHDYWFSSILSMMNVQTSVYNPKLDLFAGCRAGASS
jgi:lipid A ethanolaminephosphotransferase